MATFSRIGTVRSTEEIIQEINNRYDCMFHYDRQGNRTPLVCTFCDEILMCWEEVNYVSFEKLEDNRSAVSWESNFSNNARITSLEDKFSFQGSLEKLPNVDVLDGLALSPRGCIGRKKKRQT